MKKLIIPFLFIFLSVLTRGQNAGMLFEHNTSWTKILAKAKATNKYIFVDCYATWCGPCKVMANTVFIKPDVGLFYNANYISVKAQMDSSAKDDLEIKAHYQDNHMLLTKYAIAAYPTYLIFNSNGELVQRFVGSMSSDEFIKAGKESLVPEKQFYTQWRLFDQGERSPAFLQQMAQLCLAANDDDKGKIVFREYMKLKPDLYERKNLELAIDFTRTSRDTGFSIMLDSPDRVDSILGRKISGAEVRWIIFNEEIYPAFNGKPGDSTALAPDWQILKTRIAEKYPAHAEEVVTYGKVIYYRYVHQWNEFASAVTELMKNYADDLNPDQANEYAWIIFQQCNDMALIQKTLDWSKKILLGDRPDFLDTYANLLMKAGRIGEAVEIETKAVTIAKAKNDQNLPEYQKTLDGMKLVL